MGHVRIIKQGSVEYDSRVEELSFGDERREYFAWLKSLAIEGNLRLELLEHGAAMANTEMWEDAMARAKMIPVKEEHITRGALAPHNEKDEK